MATSRIIEAIDRYIAELVTARALIAANTGANSDKVREMAPGNRRKRSPIEKGARPAATAAPVAVRILPAKERRSRRATPKSTVRDGGALSGVAPRGPVVVRAAEIAEQKARTNAASASGESTPVAQDTFQELAREVARRLGKPTGARLDATRS